jgi:predicted glycosyltransferase
VLFRSLNNSEKTIIIRQHPAERVEVINNTDSYENKIKAIFGENKRVIFIEAKKDINTYDLIENSSCVLGFSSTSIVESVALGKPAIIVSNTYYADFGIVYNANSKKEYYGYLQKASYDKLEVTQEMKDRACVSNYITQSCNWYKTEFTANRNDFLKWSSKSMDELRSDYLPLRAIVENIPISILQNKENINAR